MGEYIDVWTLKGKKQEYVYDIDDFDYTYISHSDIVKKKKTEYYNIPCAYDIETTLLKESKESFMYHWQICIIDRVIFGRRWEELQEFFSRLRAENSLNDNRRIVLYAHNLFYEYQFTQSFLPTTEIFCREPRKVMKWNTGEGIEFRCSYLLSNMSLEKFIENTPGAIYRKMTGKRISEITEWDFDETEFDYDKIRTPDTPLTNIEKNYNYCDVRGLCEAIDYRLKEDTIVSIPLTSTSYVRRDVRNNMCKNPENRARFISCRLDTDTYTLNKEAFFGGDVHANPYYINESIYNVRSKDKQSSYPYQMLVKKFPTSFTPVTVKEYSKKYYGNNYYASIARYRFKGVEYKNGLGNPPLLLYKCRNVKNIVVDSGRIVSADSIEVTLTDIDYKIVTHDYYIESIEMCDIYVSEYDYLPHEEREIIMKYYYKKCTLKNIIGHEYEYMKSKNMLNACYGMKVTDIASDEIERAVEEDSVVWKRHAPDLKSALERYYKSKSSFLSYQHGVWVVAHAREDLRKGIWLAGDDFVYSDTDSVKYVDNDRINKRFSEINEDIKSLAYNAPIPAVVDYNGKFYIMGVWEDEGLYQEFKTLGSKRYIYKDSNGEIQATFSGVSKTVVKDYVKRNGFDAFTWGLTFIDSGRMSAHYNDNIQPRNITVDGCTFKTASNVSLIKGAYEIKMNKNWLELMEGLEM